MFDQPGSCRDAVHRLGRPAGLRKRRSVRSAAGTVVVVGLGFALAPAAGAGAPVWSTATPKPNPVGALAAVSCVSSTFCAAVGESGNFSPTFKTFAETWNGRAWSVAPSTGPKGSWLRAVSCVSAVWCIAVGSTNNTAEALTEIWHGDAWSAVSTPESTIAPYPLDAVSCVSPSWCVGVGAAFKSGGPSLQTLTELWNGHAWTVVPSPSKPNGDFLWGVSCVSRRACTAVGEFSALSAEVTAKPLIERWNGTAWSIAPSPNPAPDSYVSFQSVSCTSTTFCVAVGNAIGGEPFAFTVVETWNGHTWTLLPSPQRGDNDELFGVSCSSTTACQAVGWSYSAAKVFRTLADSWDGRVWSLETSPNIGATANVLAGVACVSSTACAAVGSVSPHSNVADRSLVESYG